MYYGEETPATAPLSQPTPPPIPPDIAQRHTESAAAFPELDLLPNEYVVINVRRSLIGLIYIWLAAFFTMAVFLAGMFVLGQTGELGQETGVWAWLIGLLVIVVALFGGWIGGYVYRRNRLIVTSQRAFARVQVTPFAFRNQMIELEHVEDVSFKQSGILQVLFNYGTVHMSTVGDEHTYVLSFASDPAEQTRKINQVVQAVDEGESTTFRG
jgi:hypothetical protein